MCQTPRGPQWGLGCRESASSQSAPPGYFGDVFETSASRAILAFAFSVLLDGGKGMPTFLAWCAFVGFILLGSADAALACGCGPHTKLASVTPLANGQPFCHCVCRAGYVPITTAIITGTNPISRGCVRSS